MDKEYLVIWAKVTGHRWWPARHCTPIEEEMHVRFRQRKSDVLVHFFGADASGSYGWVIPTNVKAFDPATADDNKIKNKSLKAAVFEALGFCDRVSKGAASMIEEHDANEEGVCKHCSRDASFGTLLICDKCDDEYHLDCLDPPAASIPDGDWFCPTCNPSAYEAKRKISALESDAPKLLGRVSAKSKHAPRGPRGRPKTSLTSQDPAELVDDSEDFCMVCGSEGELLVCDFKLCRKVFHRHCIWPHSATAESEEVRWSCPRHRCVACSAEETEPVKQTWDPPPPASAPDESGGSGLHRCSRCTISFCSQHLPVGPAVFKGGYACPYCESPSPRVELAKLLHLTWSKMANHYLSLPFMRPLLSVTAAPQFDPGAEDLVSVLEKVRSLKYSSHSEFLLDLATLGDRCRAAAPDAPTLLSAFETLQISAHQILTKHQAKLSTLEALLSPPQEAAQDKARHGPMEMVSMVPGRVVGLHGYKVGLRLPDVSPFRSLKSWEEYVSNPPVFVDGALGTSLSPSSPGSSTGSSKADAQLVKESLAAPAPEARQREREVEVLLTCAN